MKQVPVEILLKVTLIRDMFPPNVNPINGRVHEVFFLWIEDKLIGGRVELL